jgi:hypothetical protein
MRRWSRHNAASVERSPQHRPAGDAVNSQTWSLPVSGSRHSPRRGSLADGSPRPRAGSLLRAASRTGETASRELPIRRLDESVEIPARTSKRNSRSPPTTRCLLHRRKQGHRHAVRETRSARQAERPLSVISDADHGFSFATNAKASGSAGPDGSSRSRCRLCNRRSRTAREVKAIAAVAPAVRSRSWHRQAHARRGRASASACWPARLGRSASTPATAASAAKERPAALGRRLPILYVAHKIGRRRRRGRSLLTSPGCDRGRGDGIVRDPIRGALLRRPSDRPRFPPAVAIAIVQRDTGGDGSARSSSPRSPVRTLERASSRSADQLTLSRSSAAA